MEYIEANSIQNIDEALWDSVTGEVLSMTHRWLRTVENTWRFYQPRYMLLKNGDGPYAAILANLSTSVEKKHGWMGWLYQRFSLVLFPPFSSLCSVVVRPDLSLDAIMPDLNTTLAQLCRQEKRLLISVGNVEADDVLGWQRVGFRASPKPGVSILDLPATYDDYLGSLHRRDRQEIRRVRRRAAEFGIRLEVGALGDDTEEVYTLIYEVLARHGFALDTMPFTLQFLAALAIEMPGDISLVRGYVGDKLVGVFLNLLDGTRLLSLIAGLHYEIARPSYLYFVMLDEMIRWGIENGYRQVYAGRTNEREKRKHGFHLEERWLCYRANIKPLQHLLPFAYQLLQSSSPSSNR